MGDLDLASAAIGVGPASAKPRYPIKARTVTIRPYPPVPNVLRKSGSEKSDSAWFA
jgi:hypothetical protein